MESKNKITLFNMASTIVLQGMAFFSGPIFSNALGTYNYGIAAVYLTWVQIASTVFSLQAGGALAVARLNYPIEDQDKYQSSILSLVTFSFVILSVIVLTFASLTKKYFGLNIPMIFVGLTHGWGLYCVSFFNGKFTYEFKADKNFILSAITSALTIGFSLLLINCFRAEKNYWGRIIGQSATYTVIGVILYSNLIKSGRTLYNFDYWKFTLPITIPTIFHALAHIVLNQSDKVMIQNMIGNSSAGIYSLAYTFSGVMSALWHAFNNSWAPFYYEYTRHNQIAEMQKHAKNYIELFSIVTIGYILLSREVFHFYAANKDFWGGTDLLPLFAVSYYFVFLYSFPVNYEFYKKKTKMIAVGTTLASVLNIFLNYFMISWWGIIGAVIATTLSHGLLFGFHFVFAIRIDPGEFPFRLTQFVMGFLAVCITCVLYWIARDIWVFRWTVGALLGIYLAMKIVKRREIF